ncbi:hypothetical protein KRP22_006691 [Phytophthora ramorum]|nr:Bidirectional sugar transporter SWEET15 [Phytophthora ramorum]
MSSWLSALLNVAAAIAQVILSLSPTPDIYKVYRRKHIGEMVALPLVAMAVNNHLWMLYGYLTDNVFPLLVTQAFSQLAAIVYNAIYFRWSSEHKRIELLKLYTRAFVLHCAVSAYFALGLAGITRQTKADVGTWLGYAGVVVNVWMYASPLATLKHVVETKNSDSIPINLSAMILVSTLLWLGTGIIDSDFFITGINAVGASLSFIQIVVYYTYRPSRNEDMSMGQEDPTNIVSVIVVSPKNDYTMLDECPAFKPISSPVTV